MKKSIIMLLCILVFAACKKENSTLSNIKKATQEVKRTANDVKNVKNVVGGLDDANELMEKLKDLEPLSNDAWKNWMPEK